MEGNDTITLTPFEAARLRCEDGMATEADIDALGDHDSAPDIELRASIGRVLRRESAPSVADSVMFQLGFPGMPVAEGVAADSDMPSVSTAVMGAIGVSESVGTLVREACLVESGTVPSLWAGIAPAVGGEDGLSLGAMLKGAVQEESTPGFTRREVFRPRRQWWTVGAAASVAFAAAAALLLYLALDLGQEPPMEASIGPILDAPSEVETLKASGRVEVMQFDAVSPTIIMVEEEPTVDGQEAGE